MAETEQDRLILLSGGVATELTGHSKDGESLLAGVMTILHVGVNSRLLRVVPYVLVSQSTQGEPKKKLALPQYYPAISPGDEMERQRYEATERVAVPLGINRNKFQAQLPTRFPDRPSEYDALHLNVPLLALNLTSFGFNWLQMTEAALFYDPVNPEITLKAYIWDELRNMVKRDQLQVWQDPRRDIQPFPQVPHAVWIQDGTRYFKRKPKDVRVQLHRLERAGDHFKGTSLALLRPDMIKPMFWDLIGGGLGSDGMPCVDWDGRPGFSYSWGGGAIPGFRALVCGSEFTVA